MPKVISDNTKNVKVYLNLAPSSHEIIAECKLVLEGDFISHFVRLGKTSNNRYKYSRLFLRPKILLGAQNS